LFTLHYNSTATTQLGRNAGTTGLVDAWGHFEGNYFLTQILAT
jgi:hypothetical protein